MSIVADPDAGFLGDDGFALPPDPLEGVIWDDPDDDEPPAAVPSGAVLPLPAPIEDQSRAVTEAVFLWEFGGTVRRRAEADEIAGMLAAEAVFRADFTGGPGDRAWLEGGGYRCFVADAARIMRVGPRTAAHRLAVAHRVHDDLPLVWDLFTRGEVGLNQVSVVAAEAEGLDDDVLPAYDEAAAALLQRQPGSRLQRRLAAARERVQSRTADERHAVARAMRNARLEPGRDGMGRLTLEGPIERLAALDQAVEKAAVAAHGHEGEQRAISALRYDVYEDVLFDGIAISAAAVRDALLVANPDSPQRGQAVPQRKRIQPTVVLHVPVLTLLGRTTEPPTIDGVGPISPEQAAVLCADAPSFFRVLTHPVTGTRITLDRTTYSPPADLRRWIQIRDEYGRFPGCRKPAHLCDIDHVQEWHDDGVTNEDNLIALSRDTHLLKSMGLYGIEGDPNGEIVFTSAMGVRHTSEPRPPADPVPEPMREWFTGPMDEADCPF